MKLSLRGIEPRATLGGGECSHHRATTSPLLVECSNHHIAELTVLTGHFCAQEPNIVL